MKGNVNPFEPWRPKPAELVPPPVNARQPWRPPLAPGQARQPEPPLVEPVAQPARPPQPEKTRRCGGRCGRRSALDTPVNELRGDQKTVLALVFGLGLLGLVGLGYLGGLHLPRVFLILLPLGVGLGAGISLARRHSWYVRLGCTAGGLALAALAGWFVPTIEGVTLWSAYAQMEELRTLPAGDFSAYLRGVTARKRLRTSFPAFREEVEAGERSWLRQTVDAVIERGDRLLETDPAKASAHLRAAARQLAGIEHFNLVESELQAARRRALRACLEGARQEFQDPLAKDLLEAAADRGRQLAEELEAEARAIGCAADLDEFRAACSVMAERARQR